MIFDHDKCSRCHTDLLGKPRDMFRSYGRIKSKMEKCKKKERIREEDEGAAIYRVKEYKRIARCPECGRKQSSEWMTKNREVKNWKDNECENGDNKQKARKNLLAHLETHRKNGDIRGHEAQMIRHKIEEMLT